MKNTIRTIGKKLLFMPVVGLGLLFGATVVNAGPPIPNTFTAGTPISSAAVNANFANIEARLAALEAVTSTTISLATIAGTWGFMADFLGGGQFVPNLLDVSRDLVYGTFVISPNGTFVETEAGGNSLGLSFFNSLITQNVRLPKADGTFNNVAVARQVDQKGHFTGSVVPAGASGTGTVSITGNKITIQGTGGGAIGAPVLRGYISQNGQVMMIQGIDNSTGAPITAGNSSRMTMLIKLR